MQTNDILKIMAGMAQYKVGLVEVGNLRLALQAPERVPMPPSASGLVPSGERQVTNEDALKATTAARVEANRLADLRLTLQQQKTAQSRRKAAGGIGPNTAGHVDTLFKASKQRASSKPA